MIKKTYTCERTIQNHGIKKSMVYKKEIAYEPTFFISRTESGSIFRRMALKKVSQVSSSEATLNFPSRCATSAISVYFKWNGAKWHHPLVNSLNTKPALHCRHNVVDVALFCTLHLLEWGFLPSRSRVDQIDWKEWAVKNSSTFFSGRKLVGLFW